MEMDPLKMYFLLEMGISIAMLVYQRVKSTASNTSDVEIPRPALRKLEKIPPSDEGIPIKQ